MPSPSKAKLFSGLAVTAVFFAVGAYAASAIGGDTNSDADPALRSGYTAALVPRAVDPRIKPNAANSEPQKVKTTERINTREASEKPEPKKHALTSPQMSKAVSSDVKRPAPPNSEAFSVKVTDIRSNYGNLIVMVFADAASYQAFDYSKAVGYAELKAKSGTLKSVFPELNDGPYVVSLFHDENADQQFNMSGDYPIEGYGTSKAKTKYDALSFSEASVMAHSITIKMHYLQ